MKNIFIISILILQVNILNAQLSDTLKFVNWLNQNLVDLDNFDKLQNNKIDSILKTKTIIGLGECVHASKTINKVRFDLSKHLIENSEFSVVAFEIAFNTGLKINEYITNGTGDIKQIISKSHFFNDSAELLDFIEWLREYNSKNNKEIHFYGFDIQSNLDINSELISYFKIVDNSVVIHIKLLKSIFEKNEMIKFGDYSQMLQDSVFSLLKLSIQKMEKNKTKYILEKGYLNYAYNLKKLNIISQYMNMLNSGYAQSLQIRDSCNAELIKWIKDFEGEQSKLILFAHNGHLGKAQRFVPRVRTLSTDAFYEGYPENLITGYWLNEIFANKYYFIGTQFGTGTFIGFDPENDYELSKLTVSIPMENSFPYLLGKANKNIYLIDFSFQPSTPRQVINYICSLQNCYEIGAAYDFKYIKTRLIDYFDAVIYIDKVKESRIFNIEN
jgi:erythromycin esterase